MLYSGLSALRLLGGNIGTAGAGVGGSFRAHTEVRKATGDEEGGSREGGRPAECSPVSPLNKSGSR